MGRRLRLLAVSLALVTIAWVVFESWPRSIGARSPALPAPEADAPSAETGLAPQESPAPREAAEVAVPATPPPAASDPALAARAPFVLHVRERGSSVDLRGVELRRDRNGLFALVPQGAEPSGEVLAEAGDSPFEIAPEDGIHTFRARTERHAWGELQTRAVAGAQATLELDTLARSGEIEFVFRGGALPAGSSVVLQSDEVGPPLGLEMSVVGAGPARAPRPLPFGNWNASVLGPGRSPDRALIAERAFRHASPLTTVEVELPRGEAATISGTLLLEPAEGVPSTLRLQLRGRFRSFRAGGAVPVELHADPARPGAFAWSADSVRPGPWCAWWGEGDSPIPLLEFEVPVEGRDDLELRAPAPCTVELELEGATQYAELIASVQLATEHGVPSYASAPVTLARRGDTELFEGSAFCGPAHLWVEPRGREGPMFSIVPTQIELGPGLNHSSVRLSLGLMLVVELELDGAPLTVSVLGGPRVLVASVSGRGQVLGSRVAVGSPGHRISLSGPDRYRVSVSGVPGCGPIPDHEVDVAARADGAPTVLRIDLTPYRGG